MSTSWRDEALTGRSHRRTVVLTAAAAATLLLVTACGAGDEPAARAGGPSGGLSQTPTSSAPAVVSTPVTSTSTSSSAAAETPAVAPSAAAPVAAPAPAPTRDPAAIHIGESVGPAAVPSLVSASGSVKAEMQPDGNLVLSRDDRPVWSSATMVAGSHAELQTDGNLVIMDADRNPLWASGTDGSGAVTLVVTDDAELHLLNASGGSLWKAAKAVTPAPVVAASSGASNRSGATTPAAGSPGAAPAAEPAAAPSGPAQNPGAASALLNEINAYRQQNGLAPLSVSGTMTSYAQSCAAQLASENGELHHCRSGEIVQYNSKADAHSWLLAYASSPAHNAIMLLPDIKYFGAGVCQSITGRWYNVVNVS